MVVKHPELVAAAERMRRLRADPEYRKNADEKRRAWRRNPENREAVRLQAKRKHQRAKERYRSESAYREKRLAYHREYVKSRRQSDPEFALKKNESARRRWKSRQDSDPAFRAAAYARKKAWNKNHRDYCLRYRRRWQKEKYHTDHSFRMAKRLREIVHRVSKVRGKVGKSQLYLGCSFQEAAAHIESLLRPGWTWDNWGSVWHIDHIFPIAAVNFNDPVEVLAVSNFRNLRPLSAADNMAKGDSVTSAAQALFESIKQAIQATRQD